MFGYIVIAYFAIYLYNVYEFDRKNLEEKCSSKQGTIAFTCDCWYMAERFDTKYNNGNGNIANQIPVVCKMRNKAYHLFD